MVVVGTGPWVAVAFPLELGMDLFGVPGHVEETDFAAEAFVDVVGPGELGLSVETDPPEEIDHGVEIVLVGGGDLAEGVEIDLVRGSYHAHQTVVVHKVVALVSVVVDTVVDPRVAGHTVAAALEVVDRVAGQERPALVLPVKEGLGQHSVAFWLAVPGPAKAAPHDHLCLPSIKRINSLKQDQAINNFQTL